MSVLTVPRGNPNTTPMSLDMGVVHRAESRLQEVAAVSPTKAPELMGYFNEACNTTTKYLAWVKYEILNAKKHLDIAKATVVLEKSVDAFEQIKEKGIKYNEDFRTAMIARDPDCQTKLDTLNALIAAEALLEGKAWSFVRAYNACKSIWERRQMTAASPNLSSGIGDEPENLMGKPGDGW